MGTSSKTTGRPRKMTLRYFIFFLSFALLASSALGCKPHQTVRPCPPGTPEIGAGAFCTSCGPIVAGGAGSWYLDFAGRNCCCYCIEHTSSIGHRYPTHKEIRGK